MTVLTVFVGVVAGNMTTQQYDSTTVFPGNGGTTDLIQLFINNKYPLLDH